MTKRSLIIVCLYSMIIQPAFAQQAPKVGRNYAAKYFQSQNQTQDDSSSSDSGGYGRRYPSSIESLTEDQHYLALGASTYTSSQAYNWGNGSEDNVGKAGGDVTYRLKQTYELFDEIVRMSYNTFQPAGQKATKMSFLYGMTFPDAGSRFPLYFGGAVGPGVYFQQLSGKSPISLDYQLFAGIRLFNVFEKTGFYVEAGLKNQFFITSDGQLNGTYVAAGAVFTF